MEALALYFLSPLPLALWLGVVAAVFRWLRRPRMAFGLAAFALGALWVGSSPWLADAMVSTLESQYPAVAADAAPQADAILVLGGSVTGKKPPERPTLMLGGSSTRVWYAAQLYRAGKAPWIVVAAGNRPGRAAEQIEADAMAELLVQLGVPASAIVLERESATTRQNASNVLPLLRRLGARRVLLVTSGMHMPRAMQTFARKWGSDGPQLIPAVTDIQGIHNRSEPWEAWFPSLEALISVTKACKEFAGMAALAIIGRHS